MRADMLAQEFGRGMARVVALRVAERGDRFERELGVDHQRALVGQKDRAIRPHPVRERELEFVGAFREPVLDDHFHAALAEGAALLLVGEHARERRHLRGQVGDVLLRAVDDGEALVELRQIVGGLFRRRLHRLAEPVGDGIEPGVHRLLQFGLLGVQHLAHRHHLAGGFRLQPRDLVHALIGEIGGRLGIRGAAARRARSGE